MCCYPYNRLILSYTSVFIKCYVHGQRQFCKKQSTYLRSEIGGVPLDEMEKHLHHHEMVLSYLPAKQHKRNSFQSFIHGILLYPYTCSDTTLKG